MLRRGSSCLAKSFEKDVQDISSATAELEESSEGVVNIRVSWSACCSDYTPEFGDAPETLVNAIVPGPCGMLDPDVVSLAVKGDMLSTSLSSDAFPWLFVPDAVWGHVPLTKLILVAGGFHGAPSGLAYHLSRPRPLQEPFRGKYPT